MSTSPTVRSSDHTTCSGPEGALRPEARLMPAPWRLTYSGRCTDVPGASSGASPDTYGGITHRGRR